MVGLIIFSDFNAKEFREYISYLSLYFLLHSSQRHYGVYSINCMDKGMDKHYFD